MIIKHRFLLPMLLCWPFVSMAVDTSAIQNASTVVDAVSAAKIELAKLNLTEQQRQAIEQELENIAKESGQDTNTISTDAPETTEKDPEGEYCPAKGNRLKSITDATKVGDFCSSSYIAVGKVKWYSKLVNGQKVCTCLASVCTDGNHVEKGKCVKDVVKLADCPRQEYKNVSDVKSDEDALDFCEAKGGTQCKTMGALKDYNGVKGLIICNPTTDESKTKELRDEEQKLKYYNCGDSRQIPKDIKCSYVSDFKSYKITPLEAEGLMKEYVLKKYKDDIKCDEKSHRSAEMKGYSVAQITRSSSDKWRQCVSRKNNNTYYEFEFKSLDDGNKDYFAAVCKIWELDYGKSSDNTYYVCKKASAAQCKEISAAVKRTFFPGSGEAILEQGKKDSTNCIIKQHEAAIGSRYQINSKATTIDQFKTTDGIDLMHFYDKNIQLNANKTLYTDIQTYLFNELGLPVKPMQCSSGYVDNVLVIPMTNAEYTETRTKINNCIDNQTKGFTNAQMMSTITRQCTQKYPIPEQMSDILTCEYNGKRFDLAFKKLDVKWDKKSTGGYQGVRCLTNGGTFTGKTCGLASKKQCDEFKADFEKEFPGSRGVEWDPDFGDNGGCILKDAKYVGQVQKVAETTGMVALTLVTSVAGGPIVWGLAVVEATALVTEAKTEAKLSDWSDKFISDATQCSDNDSACADAVLKKHIARIIKGSKYFDETQGKAIAKQTVRLMGIVPAETLDSINDKVPNGVNLQNDKERDAVLENAILEHYGAKLTIDEKALLRAKTASTILTFATLIGGGVLAGLRQGVKRSIFKISKVRQARWLDLKILKIGDVGDDVVAMSKTGKKLAEKAGKAATVATDASADIAKGAGREITPAQAKKLEELNTKIAKLEAKTNRTADEAAELKKLRQERNTLLNKFGTKDADEIAKLSTTAFDEKAVQDAQKEYQAALKKRNEMAEYMAAHNGNPPYGKTQYDVKAINDDVTKAEQKLKDLGQEITPVEPLQIGKKPTVTTTPAETKPTETGGKGTQKPTETGGKPTEPETGTTTPKPVDSAPKGKSIEEIEKSLGDRYANVKPELKNNPDKSLVFQKNNLTDAEWETLNKSLAKDNLEVVPSGNSMVMRQKRVYPDTISDIRNRAYSEFNAHTDKIQKGIEKELHIPKEHLSDEEWKLLEADLKKEGLEISEANSSYYTVRKTKTVNNAPSSPKTTPKPVTTPATPKKVSIPDNVLDDMGIGVNQSRLRNGNLNSEELAKLRKYYPNMSVDQLQEQAKNIAKELDAQRTANLRDGLGKYTNAERRALEKARGVTDDVADAAAVPRAPTSVTSAGKSAVQKPMTISELAEQDIATIIRESETLTPTQHIELFESLTPEKRLEIAKLKVNSGEVTLPFGSTVDDLAKNPDLLYIRGEYLPLNLEYMEKASTPEMTRFKTLQQKLTRQLDLQQTQRELMTLQKNGQLSPEDAKRLKSVTDELNSGTIFTDAESAEYTRLMKELEPQFDELRHVSSNAVSVEKIVANGTQYKQKLISIIASDPQLSRQAQQFSKLSKAEKETFMNKVIKKLDASFGVDTEIKIQYIDSWTEVGGEIEMDAKVLGGAFPDRKMIYILNNAPANLGYGSELEDSIAIIAHEHGHIMDASYAEKVAIGGNAIGSKHDIVDTPTWENFAEYLFGATERSSRGINEVVGVNFTKDLNATIQSGKLTTSPLTKLQKLKIQSGLTGDTFVLSPKQANGLGVDFYKFTPPVERPGSLNQLANNMRELGIENVAVIKENGKEIVVVFDNADDYNTAMRKIKAAGGTLPTPQTGTPVSTPAIPKRTPAQEEAQWRALYEKYAPENQTFDHFKKSFGNNLDEAESAAKGWGVTENLDIEEARNTANDLWTKFNNKYKIEGDAYPYGKYATLRERGLPAEEHLKGVSMDEYLGRELGWSKEQIKDANEVYTAQLRLRIAQDAKIPVGKGDAYSTFDTDIAALRKELQKNEVSGYTKELNDYIKKQNINITNEEADNIAAYIQGNKYDAEMLSGTFSKDSGLNSVADQAKGKYQELLSKKSENIQKIDKAAGLQGVDRTTGELIAKNEFVQNFVSKRVSMYEDIITKNPSIYNRAKRWKQLSVEEKEKLCKEIFEIADNQLGVKRTEFAVKDLVAMGQKPTTTGLQTGGNVYLSSRHFPDMSFGDVMGTIAHEQAHKVDKLKPNRGILGSQLADLGSKEGYIQRYAGHSYADYRKELTEQSSWMIDDAMKKAISKLGL